MDKDLNHKIQERAYELWEREGRSGDPEEHWYRAEQELRDTPATEVGASGAKAAEDKIIDKLGDFA